MSVLFLPPSAGAASVPDASETVSGKIRISTSAEATAGTNDLTAMTPAKTKSVVDAAVVGGVTYQGTFDASAPADLSNTEKGDLYIISVAGTYQGQTWAVGDHLLINADMGGTLDPAKIDKVDNTDSVTSVAGRTGAVTLSTADISGLATVASTGAYSDLTGAPTLATVATTGAYSDLSGTPSLATVATTGAYSDLTGTPTLATVATTGAYSDLTGTPTLGTAAAEDVGTSAGNVVQLDGTAKLPAVDGSQLTNLPTSGFTYQEQSTNAFNVSVTDSTNNIVMCSILGTNTTVLPASSGVADGTVVTLRAAIGTTLSVSGGENLRNLTGTLVSSVVIESGQNMSFVRGSTSSFGTYWNQLTAEEGTLNSLYDVKTAGAVATNVLKYDGTDWVDGAVAYSEVTGTPTLATVATTGAYSDLTGTPTLGTAAALDVGTSANNVVQLNGSAQLPAVDGSQLTNLPSASVAALGDIGDVTITSVADGQFLKYDSVSGDWVNSDSGLYAYYSFSTTSTLAAPAQSQTLVVSLSSSLSQTLTLPTGSNDFAGTTISFANLNSGEWTIAAASGNYIRGLSTAPTLAQNQAIILTLASSNTWLVVAYEEQGLGSLADVDVTGAVATNVLKYDGTDWVDGAVAYSEVTGTPTLGTAAALDVGTSANNVVQLNGSAQLPAVDGSLLTGITATVAALNDVGDVNAPTPANTNVIKYNSTSGDWESGAVAASEVSGLATVATTGAYSDLTGTPTLATVATTGAYSDLTGTPTLGTAAALDVGTSASNVVQLDGSARLPAVDGSQLLNLPSAPVTSVAGKTGAVTLDLNDNTDVSYTPGAGIDNYVLTYDHATTSWGAEPSAGGGGSAPTVTVSSPATDQTLTSPSGIEEVYIYTPSASINVNLVAAATCGSGFKYQIKNRSASNTLTIDPNGAETIDGSATFAISSQEASVTLITDGSNWFII